MSVTGTPAPDGRTFSGEDWKSGLVIRYPVVGLILVVDQLLLPMFHVGSTPYKVSYFLLALWALSRVTHPEKGVLAARASRDFRRFAAAFAAIIGCGLLGEAWLSAFYPITSHSDAWRSITIYVLVVLAFGVGLDAAKFNLKWLLWVFYIAVILNLGFALLRGHLPRWLIDFYYSKLEVEAFADPAIVDADDLLNLVRPRGIFPNPNAAMLLVNVIVVFIYASLRLRLLSIRSGIAAMSVIVLPLLLAAVLASRGEFIASSLLAIANYRIIFKNATSHIRRKARMLAAVMILALIGTLVFMSEESPLLQNFDRIATIINALDTADRGDYESRNQSVSRPLLKVEEVFDRFIVSPVFGSGFSSSNRHPTDSLTQYYHNDWFRLAVTSGIIGVFSMLWILREYCLPLGPLAVLPFAIAGLTNTFMLNIPAFMFYFFMVGVLRQKLRLGQVASGQRAPAER